MSAINPRRWWALVVLAAAQFMAIMDTSIIGVALPEMQKDLGFSQGERSWAAPWRSTVPRRPRAAPPVSSWAVCSPSG
ncbi:hypothetical protein GCM10023100_74840 [Actinocorallia cavernae]|uniref:Major facilitator superfamily (MFS) profile domain-containing protein n=2 Tax=Actinomycetes TaxID=1760 RepID=A0ABP5XXZ7_9ACTN